MIDECCASYEAMLGALSNLIHNSTQLRR